MLIEWIDGWVDWEGEWVGGRRTVIHELLRCPVVQLAAGLDDRTPIPDLIILHQSAVLVHAPDAGEGQALHIRVQTGVGG